MNPPPRPSGPGLSPPLSFLSSAQTLGIALAPAMLDTLGRLVHLVGEANRIHNLTAPCSDESLWLRHVLDSLTLLPRLSPPDSLLDLGSGGGFPGLPLAIALPQTSIHLLEATGKKAHFLAQTASALGLDRVQVHAGRAEDLGRDPALREQFPVVTARAVASLPALLELALPFLEVGGRLYAMKGRKAEEELGEARRALDLLGGEVEALHRPTPDSVIVVVTKRRHTPAEYPRRNGIPAKTPL